MSIVTKGLVEVDPTVVAGWIAAGEAHVVDVREIEEWDEERVEGTVLAPMSDFELETFPIDATKRLVLMCAVGRRSAAIGNKLLQNGHTLAYNMTGGINGWKEAELPTLR